MKVKLTSLAVAMIVLLTTLSGCSVSTPSAHVDEADDVTPVEMRHRMQWVEIPVGKDTVFAKEVLQLIETSKTLRKGDEDHSLFSQNELPKITEFYNLDKFNIEGYELGRAFVNSVNFIFDYFRDTKEMTAMSGRIVVTITRPDYMDTHLPDTDLYKYRLEHQDPKSIRLTEDDMLYYEMAGMIEARLGRTTVSVQPQMLGEMSYEELRDLALRVIESAELVTVKG